MQRKINPDKPAPVTVPKNSGDCKKLKYNRMCTRLALIKLNIASSFRAIPKLPIKQTELSAKISTSLHEVNSKRLYSEFVDKENYVNAFDGLCLTKNIIYVCLDNFLDAHAEELILPAFF